MCRIRWTNSSVAERKRSDPENTGDQEDAVQDLNLRIDKILRNTPMEEADRENVLQAVDTAAGKVVNKLIFGLRDSLNQEAFRECVAGTGATV